MNTKEKQNLANQLGTQIIALQKIKEALEKSDIDSNTPTTKPPAVKGAGWVKYEKKKKAPKNDLTGW
jgi:ornithine cyclodeaminase/alanine dehydrogenase-like protein (mu-crystallin family)